MNKLINLWANLNLTQLITARNITDIRNNINWKQNCQCLNLNENFINSNVKKIRAWKVMQLINNSKLTLGDNYGH